LSRCNRWLLAGSVTLTGVFSALAAQAFPGKTRTAKGVGTSGKASRSGHHATPAHATHKVGPAEALKSPAQAPEAASSTSTQVSGATQTNTEQTATSTQATSTPEAQTATTEQTTTPTETTQTTETPTSAGSSSESSSAPVVSGGS
jgi:hypothetical protein